MIEGGAQHAAPVQEGMMGEWDGVTRVYDPEGNERDGAWLEEWFGGVEVEVVRAVVDPPGYVWRCAELRTKDGEAAQVVFTRDVEDGVEVGVKVARWWPDAPDLDGDPIGCLASRWYGNGVEGVTDGVLGDVGFGMGGGDEPPGYSAVWVRDCVAPSDLVSKLGWAAGGTNHRVVWPVFRLVWVEEEPEEPELDDLTEAVLAVACELAGIREVLERGWVWMPAKDVRA